MEDVKSLEKSMRRTIKRGRVEFAISDSLGKAGKISVTVGAILLFFGASFAYLTDYSRGRVEAKKRKLVELKKNK